MTKQTKKEKRDNKIIRSIIVGVASGFFSFMLFVAIFLSLFFIFNYTPTKTLYLSSYLFPIKEYDVENSVMYVFSGTPLSNGTECINRITAIYLSNNTIQNISNPKQVADIYYSSEIDVFYNLPAEYTLLCPNIVNATKVI